MERTKFVLLIAAFTIVAVLVQDFTQIVKADLVGALQSLAEYALGVLGVLVVMYGETRDQQECGTGLKMFAKFARAFGIILMCTMLPDPWYILLVLPLAYALGSRLQVKMYKRELRYNRAQPYWPVWSISFSLLAAAAVLRGVPQYTSEGKGLELLALGGISTLLAFAFALPWRK